MESVIDLFVVLFALFNNNNNNNNNVTCIAQIRQSRKCAATCQRQTGMFSVDF